MKAIHNECNLISLQKWPVSELRQSSHNTYANLVLSDFLHIHIKFLLCDICDEQMSQVLFR